METQTPASVSSMSDLAAAAGSAVSDLFEDDEEWEEFDARPDVDKVQWRYCHADCDDFATVLSEVTGWPVVGLTNPSRGPLHRLVEVPDGRLLDARGWVTLDDLRARYKLKVLKIARSAHVCFSNISDDEDYHEVLSAMLQLPPAPFNEDAFRSKVVTFARQVGLAA